MANQNLFNALHALGVIALQSEMETILRAVAKDAQQADGEFYVMAKSGQKPPKYKHGNLDSALAEAQRISRLNDTDCEVLEIVAAVVRKSVQVTRTEVQEQIIMVGGGVVNLPPCDVPIDDLPF